MFAINNIVLLNKQRNLCIKLSSIIYKRNRIPNNNFHLALRLLQLKKIYIISESACTRILGRPSGSIPRPSKLKENL